MRSEEMPFRREKSQNMVGKSRESGAVVSLGSVALVPALKSMEENEATYRSFISFPVLAFV